MIFSLLIYPLLAMEVFIQGPGTSEIEFQKELLKSPQAISYSEYSRKSKTHSEIQIIDDFKKGQFEFLKGSIEESKAIYIKIAERRSENHWSRKTREIIHYCHMRTAQLVKNENERKKWLKLALIFDSSIRPDKKLFPPPLIKKYNSLKDELSIQIWPLPNKSENFNTLFINGQEIERNSSFIRHRPGVVKISFFSNKNQPAHFVTHLKNLSSLKLPTHPLFQGDCPSASLDVEVAQKDSIRILDGSCKQMISPNHQLASPVLSDTPPATKPPVGEKRFYKSTWFWVGVSVLAAGLTWHSLNQQNQNAPEPPPQPTQSGHEFSNQ